jgi:hypothetical protein
MSTKQASIRDMLFPGGLEGKQRDFDPGHVAWMLEIALGPGWSVEYNELAWFEYRSPTNNFVFCTLEEDVQAKVEEVVAAMQQEGVPHSSEHKEWLYRWNPDAKQFDEEWESLRKMEEAAEL